MNIKESTIKRIKKYYRETKNIYTTAELSKVTFHIVAYVVKKHTNYPEKAPTYRANRHYRGD